MTVYAIVDKSTSNIRDLSKSSSDEDLSLLAVCRTRLDAEALLNEYKDKSNYKVVMMNATKMHKSK